MLLSRGVESRVAWSAKLRASVAVVAAVSGWTNALLAEPVLRVRVEPVSGCMGEFELKERVARLLSANEAMARAEVEVTFRAQVPAGYRADVAYESSVGRRERSISSSSPDCRDLDEALVVVIDAFTSDAARSDDGELPRSKLLRAPSKPLDATSRRERRPGSAGTATSGSASPAPAPHLAFLGLGLELGTLPAPSLFTRLDARFAFDSPIAIRFGLGTTPWASSRSYSSATVDFRLTSARILGCFDWVAAPRGYVDTCAGVDGGAIVTTSSGLERDTTTARGAVWPLAGASAGFRFRSLVPEVIVLGGPALGRDRYYVTDLAGERRILYGTARFRWGVGVALGASVP